MKPEQFGKYTLLRPLGKGGMAEVFLGRARSSEGFERVAAVKRLLPPYNRDEQVISMLADEARLSVWLNHPNIVQILDFGRVGATHYLAMEYVDGCDLCDLVRPPDGPGRALPLATGLYVVAQVADALGYAHRRRSPGGESLGIIHRDVSPQNVLLSREGQVKLTDFGLARASVSLHYSTADVIRGKFSYMPKEQAHGRAIDHRIDIFALGVTFYEAICGVKPYNSNTLAEQLYQLEQPVVPPSSHNPELPPHVDAIALRALATDPDARYDDAAEMGEELQTALAELSTYNQEAARLAELVNRRLGGPAQSAVPLPSMSLREITIDEESMISDELEAVLHGSEVGVDGEDPDEGLRTLAITPDDGGPASSLPPAALAMGGPGPGPAPAAPETLPPTDLYPGPPQSVVAGEISHHGPAGMEPATGQYPGAATVAVSGALYGESSEEVDPLDEQDTVFDPEAAGRAARRALRERAGVELMPGEEEYAASADEDEARTIQRSPEEMLTAFQRALEDREARKRQKVRRKRVVQLAAGLGAAALFALGIAVGVLVFSGDGKEGGEAGATADSTGGSATAVARAGEAKAGEAKAGEAKAGEAKAGEAKAGEAKTDQAKTDQAKTDQAKTDQAKADQAKADEAKADEAKAANEDAVETEARTKPAPARPRPKPRPARQPRPRRADPPVRVRSVPTNMGYLSVRTDAPARIYIDDRSSSVPAPLERMPLKPGVHRVRVFFTNQAAFSDTQWVSVTAGKNFSLFFSSATVQ